MRTCTVLKNLLLEQNSVLLKHKQCWQEIVLCSMMEKRNVTAAGSCMLTDVHVLLSIIIQMELYAET